MKFSVHCLYRHVYDLKVLCVSDFFNVKRILYI